MANSFIKAERVVRTALAMLEREIVLPRLVWRDAGGDFAGAKGDTISIRLPAVTSARTRVLRGGTPITVDELTETKVDVTLDTDVYKAVGISDEELTLDIEDFGSQVLTPVVASVARGIEDAVATEITSADYHTTIDASSDVWLGILNARKALNDARVPMAGRFLAVGSEFEVKLLSHDKFVKVNESGTDDALRDAEITKLAGFRVVTVPALQPDMAVAAHQTAFVLSMKAPVVPDGAAWGTSQSFAGLAMRALRDYDFLNVRDRLLADVFVGTNVVLDEGHFDANGLWVADSTSAGTGPAVTLATSAAADDILDTATAHGFEAGDEVVFSGLTGGAGLTDGTTYYVIAASLAAQTFKVSATPGGSAVNFTTDITAGTVAEASRPELVRAVKLTV